MQACSTTGCKRTPTKRSGYTWCWFCDPDVPEGEKYLTRSRGGTVSQSLPQPNPTAKDPTLGSEKRRRRYLERIAGAKERGEIDKETADVAIAAVREARTGEYDLRKVVVLERLPDPAPRFAVKIRLDASARDAISVGRGGEPPALAIEARAEGGPDGNEPSPEFSEAETPKSGDQA